MDQESFRKLLHTPRAGGSTPTQRGSLLAAPKAKKVDSSQPTFKPRTVKKKSEGPYRDRASERRLGTDSDYAQVEALADDFERRTAAAADRAAVEEQRKYLGGDSEHTVLVKGLDFALFAQNKARLASHGAAVDDDTLEQAFEEATAERKRTREEIVAELKNKRAKTDNGGAAADPAAGKLNADLEVAKKSDKFRPIGFKPIGRDADKPKKKVKVKKSEGEGKKKKKQIEATAATNALPVSEPVEPAPTPVDAAGPSKPTVPQEPEPEPIPDDFDIFADADEYTGVDIGGGDDESVDEGEKRKATENGEREEGEADSDSAPPPRKWFETEDDRPLPPPAPAAPPRHRSGTSPSPASGRSAPPEPDVEDGEEEEERLIRLQPLASSAIPSIKELLAMDTAVDKADKRRARKEKRKAGGGEGGGKTDKDKLERDYKRLEAYQKKKAAG